MALLSEVKYETEIKTLKDISSESASESVLSMLRDVRINIGKVDSSFADVDLRRVLEVVEAGKYEINGSISTRIDFSFAKDVIDTYRRYSERGCQSCVSFGRETIDAQDASTGWYCKVSDLDYDANTIGKPGVKYSGFSPKVEKYYNVPCDDWKPRFSPRLEEFIDKE